MSKIALLIVAVFACAVSVKAQTCTPVEVARNETDAKKDNGTGFNVIFWIAYGTPTPFTIYSPADDNLTVHTNANTIWLKGNENGYLAIFGGFGGCSPTVTWNYVWYHQYKIYQDGQLYWSVNWERTGNINNSNNQNVGFSFDIPLNDGSYQIGINPGHTYVVYDYAFAEVGFVAYSPASYQTLQYGRHMTIVSD